MAALDFSSGGTLVPEKPLDFSQHGVPVDAPTPVSIMGPNAADAAAISPLAKSDPNADSIGKALLGAQDVGATVASRYTPAGLIPAGAGMLSALGTAGSEGGKLAGGYAPFLPAPAKIALALANNDAAKKVGESFSQTAAPLQFEPSTEAGKVAAAPADAVFGALGRGGDYVGNKVTDYTGSKGLGMLANTATQIVPMLLGERAIRGGIDTARAVRAADLSRGDQSIPASIDTDMAGITDRASLSDMLTKGATDTPAPTPADGLKTMLDQVKTTIAQGLAPKPEPESAPVQPPPPAVAAGLKAVTGGDPQKMAAVIQGAVGDKLKPGETPENLAAAAKEAIKSAPALPPHLQRLADKLDARRTDFTVTDVTPDGYGPAEPTADSVPAWPHSMDTHLTTEQQSASNSIAEAKTILRGKLTPEKRAQVERSLASNEAKLEALNNAANRPVAEQPGGGGTGTGVDTSQVSPEAAARAAVLEEKPDAAPPLHPWTPVDTTKPIPLAGGVVEPEVPGGPQKVAIDPRIPQFVKVDGKDIDAHEAIGLHERTEKTLMEQGLDYADAHDLATKAENAFVAKKYGIDPQTYQDSLKPHIANALKEASNDPNIPPTLDTKPYTDEGDGNLLKPEPVTQPASENTAIAAPDTASSELAVKPISGSEKPISVFDPARLDELRQARDSETATPEQLLELSKLQDTAAHTADVNGELIPGVLNARGREQLEASGQMKPVRVKTDLDDFKDINDTLGHDVGDQALKLKAEAMRDAFGPGNVWREGGDEFGAHADTEEAAHAAMQQVRDKLAGARLERVDDDGNVLGSKPMKVSYGVGRGKTPKEAAKAADNALYADKNARTAAGERTGRRSTDARPDVAGVGAGNEVQTPEREVSPSGSEEVAVAEPATKAEKPPPTKPVETAASAEPEKATGTSPRNAAIDADRERYGLDDLEPAEREHWEKPLAEAQAKIAADPSYPEHLAREVVAKPRALTTTETMALTADLKRLDDEHAAATQAILDAQESGDTNAEVRARIQQQGVLNAIDRNHEAIRKGGTEAARSLSIRNAILKDDYSLGRNMNRAKAAYGDKFNADLQKKVEDLSAKLKEKDDLIAGMQRKKQVDANTRMQARLTKDIADMEAKLAKRLKVCPI